ncbi:hypothetical protein LQ327_00665 [Actinomycetospora endophytica]|uniref:Uncharacterized protein n=1 Tax=Actinomycetospora endophytica TaxID=2291215 RepID=A0ABS8P0X5_9PSEU|nr:hypothetical protein [Actinomycetospora endophytica]MCD2191901.1 hypothetical protein [Actinomycetospora endophytica]
MSPPRNATRASAGALDRRPDPRRAARRLTVTSLAFAGVIYLLGWAGPEPDLFRSLNVLSLVTAACALGLGRTSYVLWAGLAAVLAACVGVGGLGRLDGAGILAVMCSLPSAAALAAAWFARAGHTGWLPPTLFPPPPREPTPAASHHDHPL